MSFAGPRAVVVGAWMAAAVVWLIGSLTAKATVRRQSLGSRLLEIVPVVLGVILLRTNPFRIQWPGVRFVPLSLGWQSVGAAVTAGGVALAIWARFYLGTNWSATVTVKQDHHLIRSGPYAVVRHPIYSGFLLAVLGTAIYIGEVRGLFGVTLAMLGWKLKSRHEEAFMESEFGDEYVTYKREVKALIPFVW